MTLRTSTLPAVIAIAVIGVFVGLAIGQVTQVSGGGSNSQLRALRKDVARIKAQLGAAVDPVNPESLAGRLEITTLLSDKTQDMVFLICKREPAESAVCDNIRNR